MRRRVNPFRAAILCLLLSACAGTRQVISIPMTASADSVSAEVVRELWRYYAGIARTADSLRSNRPPTRGPCTPTSTRGPLPSAKACVAYAYSQKEDPVFPNAILRHTDSLADRLTRLRVRTGSHEVLDNALIFAHAWRRSSDALHVPVVCGTVSWWCHALRGLVHHRLGETENAEQHFARMFAEMPQNEACGWHMLGMLPRATCKDASPATDSLMWWLADPLWLEPGNDRWTEHLSRHVLFRVFEHQDGLLRRAHNNPKQSKSMVEWSRTLGLSRAVRYGNYWVGAYEDIERHRLLRTTAGAWLRELSGPRYEFSPVDPKRFTNVASNDTSELAAWPAPPALSGIGSCPYLDCLTRPGADIMQSQSMLTSRGRIRRFLQEGFGVNESYGRHQQFDRVREFQVVTLPRDSARMLYTAYAVRRVLDQGLMGAAFSRSPTDSIVRLHASDRSGDVVRVAGALPVDGGVLSLEAVTNPQQVWRHRFFLPADSARDVSPVVLLHGDQRETVTRRSSELPTELPLNRLLPRTWLHTTDRLTLYWEVSDSAYASSVALEFRRADKSAWQQVTGSFRRGDDGRSVRVEPGALSPMVRSGRRVGFGLPFSMSGLEPGSYEVRALARDAQTGVERAGVAIKFELRGDS
jgi:hypothetical protein